MTTLPFALVLLIAVIAPIIILGGMAKDALDRRSRRRALVITVPAPRPRQPSTPNAGPYRAPSERRAAAAPNARRETLHYHSHPEADELVHGVRNARWDFESQYPRSGG